MAAPADIDALLAEQEGKDLLRFITCGSVDDGKSTLIGRMLFESRMIFSDQLAALEEDSRKFGTTGGEPDFALLVDGLAAEREQGITIDVAYRFFATGRRRFIVADTPGHEQYTRNMATGASTADAAVLMVDARKGLLPQTRRHSFIVSMMGVRQVILAVNKMDLAGYAQEVFDRIVEDYAAVAETLGIDTVTPVPVSALKGDNVVETSGAMPWYKGPPLMRILEAATPRGAQEGAFRMPVQRVCRPDDAFRGFAGRIAAGTVAPGDSVVILPSGHAARVKEVITYDGPLEAASAGRSVTLTLAEEVDVARGDVIAAAGDPCATARHFAARLIWMSEAPMVPSRQYILQSGTARAFCTPGTVKSRVDVNTLAEIPGRPLKLNEIGACNIALDREIAFAPYAENRTLGAFILVDRVSHETVAAGMIDYALRRATNVQAQDITVTPAERAALKGQKPFVVWFTGLSGAGKSSTADELEKALHAMGRHTMLLDGDNIRLGLNNNLGFTPEDRAENIRRIAEVAKLMSSAGLITLTSFISPYRTDRETARRLIGAERFVEVFVDVPLEVAEKRDPKGLYKKARAGEIPNFTGIGAPYEAPENPQVHLRADTKSPRDMAQDVIAWLEKNGYL